MNEPMSDRIDTTEKWFRARSRKLQLSVWLLLCVSQVTEIRRRLVSVAHICYKPLATAPWESSSDSQEGGSRAQPLSLIEREQTTTEALILKGYMKVELNVSSYSGRTRLAWHCAVIFISLIYRVGFVYIDTRIPVIANQHSIVSIYETHVPGRKGVNSPA